MSEFDWDNDKNEFLLEFRGVCFEDVVFHIQNGDLLDVVEHHNKDKYPGQKIIVIKIESYVFLVPYIKNKGIRFLKTIIPSRKATKEYLL